MLPVPTSVQPGKEGVVFQYDGVDLNTIIEGVNSFFEMKGYRLESGAPGNAVYGIGNNILRILLGAFVKRYTFSVKVSRTSEQGPVIFLLAKAMSGAVGGAIGYTKMNNEFNNLIAAFRSGT